MSLEMERKGNTFKNYEDSKNGGTVSLNGTEYPEELMATGF